MFSVFRNVFLCLILSISSIFIVSAQVVRSESDSEKFYIRSTDPSEYPERHWQHWDRNQDGSTDYVVLVNATGRKIQEVYDYSHDGSFDDFYFYDDGELVLRELDTNHDGQIDMWVELTFGYLVTGVRRDTSGDGIADVVRSYE